MGKVWDLALPPSHKYVLLAITDEANDENNTAPVRPDSICRRTGYSAKRVDSILRQLEKKGVLAPVKGYWQEMYRIDFSNIPYAGRFEK
jgi:predicted Rossmann fold nucleotide-binding protein DprA/Smf involved in DNA uptake